MGSLENTLTLARAASQALHTVQAPPDVRYAMDTIVHPCHQALLQQGPKDQWWDHIANLFKDCISQAPPDCQSLAEHARWVEHLNRFWSTALSAREMFITWTGSDPTRSVSNIVPADLVTARTATQAEAKKMIGEIERIGNETLAELKKRGMDSFGPMTNKQYQGYFVRHLSPQTRFISPKADPATLCGFYNWIKMPPSPPKSILKPEQRIGNEILRIRTMWPAEIIPDRVAFRPVSKHGITAEEGLMRILFDLMQASIDTQLPVVLSPSRKKP